MSGIVCHVNEMERFADAQYIGRRANRFGLPESPFANPFLVKDLGRPEAIEKYISHLIGRPDLLHMLPELRGRPLACWCRSSIQTKPPCHGDVLLALLEKCTDDLLRNLQPMSSRPIARVYTAYVGLSLYSVELGAMGTAIYRDLFPSTWTGAPVHG